MRKKIIDLIEMALAGLLVIAAVVMLFFNTKTGEIMLIGGTVITLILLAISKEFRGRF